ncbi:hypothetical protein AB0K05_17455 [Nonomuraea sp. NPDC049486]
MRKLEITISIPWWVIHAAWMAAIATLAAVALLKSGADISVKIG